LTFATITFSVQVPEMAIVFGPVAGREAMAAFTLVNAPGVPPGQPTVVSAARAELRQIRASNKADINLESERQVLMNLSFVR
jgi:hypothetical protein